MKSIIIVVSFFLLSYSAIAQTEMKRKYTSELGIHAGFTTGIGLSYRYWPGILGFQMTALPIKKSKSWTDILGVQDFFQTEELFEDDFKMTSLGLTILIKLKQEKRAKFFSYIGNHYIMTNRIETYNVGAGFGFAIESPVSFNFMIGYGAYDILNALKLLPACELGIYQRF